MVAAKLSEYHPFRSAKARDKYLAFYDEYAAKWWPKESEARTVTTREGETFMHVNGPVDAPPLVLLPGVRANSRSWSLNIEGLSTKYRTYAFDPIYDVGRSVSAYPIKKKADAMAWLDGLFDELGLTGGINLMGASLGSHITAEYAMHAPERLSKVVFLSMAGGVSAPNMAALVPIFSLALIPPWKQTITISMSWFLQYAARSDGKARELFDDFVKELVLWIKCFRITMPPSGVLRVLSDSELQNFKVPVLYIAGEDERACSTQRAIERLSKVAPAIKTFVVPKSGHDACWVQADLVNEQVMKFLAE
jgi:pimeloyl-ACP methyl ester carboxylesterase